MYSTKSMISIKVKEVHSSGKSQRLSDWIKKIYVNVEINTMRKDM